MDKIGVLSDLVKWWADKLTAVAATGDVELVRWATDSLNAATVDLSNEMNRRKRLEKYGACLKCEGTGKPFDRFGKPERYMSTCARCDGDGVEPPPKPIPDKVSDDVAAKDQDF